MTVSDLRINQNVFFLLLGINVSSLYLNIGLIQLFVLI